MASYSDVYGRIVEKFQETIGEVAVTQAEQVSGVKLDDNNQPIEEVTPIELHNLIKQYKNIMSDGAIGIAREAVREIYQEDPSVSQLELDDSIVPKEVKAEKFASVL